MIPDRTEHGRVSAGMPKKLETSLTPRIQSVGDGTPTYRRERRPRACFPENESNVFVQLGVSNARYQISGHVQILLIQPR